MVPAITLNPFDDSPELYTTRWSRDDRPDSPFSDDSEIFEQDLLEPLAIVGFSLKFPQDATSSEYFWNMLVEARNVSTEFPKERMNIDAFHEQDGDRQGTVSFPSYILLFGC